MKTKKENPVLLLLKWAEKDRGFLIASVICAFLGGLLAIGPYIGIYRLMDAFLTDTCSIQVISENAVLITATVIIRQVFQGLSGIFSLGIVSMFMVNVTFFQQTKINNISR